jgi:hypothetical protein
MHHRSQKGPCIHVVFLSIISEAVRFPEGAGIQETLDRRGHPGEFRMSDDLALNEKINAAEG